eukprot:165518-Pyramimonas_sp.AAC.1
MEALKLTIQTTTDVALKDTLQQKLAAIQNSQASEGSAASVGAAETLRKAVGAWKDADFKHGQAVSNVVRLRESLATAEAKETAAAETLAQATL